ncbi:MAG: nucleotidyltransferase family protein [Bacteroidota bacterium]
MTTQTATPFEIVCALARVHLTEDTRRAWADQLTPALPWRDVMQTAARHRVMPLIYANLATHYRDVVPADLLAGARTYFYRSYHYIHRLQEELAAVRGVLADAGVESIAFKGPVLAAMAYGAPKYRLFSDLDVMVQVHEVPQARAALADAGWQEPIAVQPDYGDRWSSYWPWHRPHGNANGYVKTLDNGAYTLALDLHWGLASRYFRLDADPAAWWARRQTVTLPDGQTVPTFSDEDTFIFLCMHGTKHEWERLTFVCDLAEFMRTHPALNWAVVLERAAAVRMRRVTLLGAWLAHHLLEAPWSDELADAVAADPPVILLGQQVIGFLQADKVKRGEAFRFHLGVRDRWRDALGTLWYNTTLALSATPDAEAKDASAAKPAKDQVLQS